MADHNTKTIKLPPGESDRPDPTPTIPPPEKPKSTPEVERVASEPNQEGGRELAGSGT